MGGELGDRGFGDVVGPFTDDQAAESLVNQRDRRLDDSVGFFFRRADALMRKLMVES